MSDHRVHPNDRDYPYDGLVDTAFVDSECPNCGRDIEGGDQIVFVDGEWICGECTGP